MVSPLITTKLYTPRPRQKLVFRPHLLDRVSEGLASKLLLISAPAGYGKTTLMAEWCAGQGKALSVAWLSLEESDNEPAQFLSYLIAALQHIQAGFGEDIAILVQESQPPTESAILSLLINELAHIPDDFVLVLEDYHVITTRELHQTLVFLLDHLPPQMHLVIITRSDPPLALARLRVRGQLVEVRVRDLRFTLAETTDFLSGVMNVDLSSESIQTLQGRTEGWVAALQLAAISLQGRENRSDLIATLDINHRYLVDYLVEEVLNRQPKSQRTFLLQTSILSRLSGPLCDAVTEQANGTATLAELDKANLFVLPVDGEARWYRYHQLFAKIMASHLQQTTPDQIPELHQRAARWYEQNNFDTEAIEHYLSAMDYEAAARMMGSNAVRLLTTGNLSTLLGWFKRVPDTIINKDPRLNLYRVWGLLLTAKTTDIAQYLIAAEEAASQREDLDELCGDFAAIRAYRAALQGDMDHAFNQAQEALTWLAEDNYTVRAAMAFVVGGIYYTQQNIPDALTALQQASDLGQRSGNLSTALSAMSAAGSILIDQGNLDEAEKIFERALILGTGPSGKPLPIAASVYSGLAKLHLVGHNLKKARRFAQTGMALSEQWTNVESQVGCHLALAQIDHLEGHSKEAQLALQKAKRLAATYTLTSEMDELIAACKALLSTTSTPPSQEQPLSDSLSTRELEVLKLFAKGLSNQKIAERLIISLGTVKAHSSHIYQKLNVRNRAQAVLLAKEMKLF